MRGGLVSFGQGIFFAPAAMRPALAMRSLGVTDAVLLVGAGRRRWPASSALHHRAAACRLPRHLLRHADAGAVDDRSTAFSQDLFARRLRRLQSCSRAHAPRPQALAGCQLRAFCCSRVRRDRRRRWRCCRIHFDSIRGLLSLAARDNEIRVEYLGASVRRVSGTNFVIAGLARRRRRRAGRDLARPYRPRLRATGPLRASSCSSRSWAATSA